ncbi:class A beta-lactamase BlaC [Saccharothrix mutabilis subsp. mutabilis]|uniref:Beta-lactamase n=1 Tax=Saccharothrix mutabilis subsp. mutabilis TaxID=66855 RepID=A0ABN0UBW7_9PSEU
MPARLTRRTLLGAALLPLAACTTPPPAPPATQTTTIAQIATTAPPTTTPAVEHHSRLYELESNFAARLGVYAVDTGSGATIAHRADERFAFCSTFKGLAAAAVLHRHPLSRLDTLVTYSETDLMRSSTITRQHVATGMTLRDLCDAAVRHSDGTAGNLLLREVGGPAGFTQFVRALGDTVTRMDRWEPDLTSAIPGDPRDTTSPRAIGTTYREVVLGEALPPERRDFLRDLLERSTTGARRVRAGLPPGWRAADKTGTGDRGTVNDIALAWPPDAKPLVIAIMSDKSEPDANYDEALLAQAAAYVAETLT